MKSIRLGAVAVMVLISACGAAKTGGPPTELDVPPGATLSAVADSLAAHGIIGNTFWFKVRGRLQGADRRLKPGRYRLEPGMPGGTILDILTSGAALTTKVTLPEGATLLDFERIVHQRLGIPADSVAAATANAELRQKFGITTPSIEGWLLPETFDFGRYATARQVISRFIAARLADWQPEWTTLADSAGLSREDVLTLASIVEAEAQLPDELPRIAAVYRNRLRIGMPLQADPTIQYAFLIDSGSHKQRLFNRDYGYPSRYNTYLHPGLPPTPIGNPSQAAIDAVLKPANSHDLYFVARGDGSHIFAGSYPAHLRNIRRVRQR